MRPSILYFLLLLFAIHGCEAGSSMGSGLGDVLATSLQTKPDWREYARTARWLVHQNQWGVLSTISQHLDGAPFGHAVSYSDGPLGESTGRLFFYLTTMDAAAQDLEADSRSTLTICEAQLPGGCAGTDPEDPTCAKLAISGRLSPVPPEQLGEAERLLFSRHPAMRSWPRGHRFRVYEMHIETMQLLDYYGGAHGISPEDYFAAEVLAGAAGRQES